ncbi:glycosyl transferase [Thermus composti]|uniref:Glycosyltransferase family 4 protein n=1 Tax=Thermus composti TaxID=532059 RepID=A0ABV6Q088_9DEIN|nr:glycosyltransferase family 4 protein [Thermus composti]GGM93752.1 glycosyl transferase [Thermus composti]
MLEVAFLTDAPRVAGSEIWLLEVLPLLPRLGIHPTVFLPKSPALRGLASRFEQAGIPVIQYPSLAKVLSDLKNFHARVLQAWFPSTYNLLRYLPEPRLVYIHDQLEYHYPFGLDRLYRAIYRYTKAHRIRLASRILVGTYWAADYLSRHFGLQAHTVPSGVNPERFRPPTPTERKDLRARFGFHRFTVLTPARFTLEKNHLVILQTAKRLPDVDFALAGDGELARLIKALAILWKLNNVRFLGNRWDIAEVYRASDAVLFPTLADNPGLVILEGMSTGLPVITSPFPPQAEVISPLEGCLVPPTPYTLAEAIRWLIDHPSEAQAMGKRGRERVVAQRTTLHTAQALAACLHETKSVQSP